MQNQNKRTTGITNKERHGDDFYSRIGKKGGRNGHTGGFYNNPERAKLAGQKGGRASKRGPTVSQRLIDNKEEVIEFSERYTYKDTARYYNVSYTTLRNFIQKYKD